MLRINLLEPSLIEAIKGGKKTQATFLWPENFTNKSNDIAIYYPEGDELRILGVAKIQSLVKIRGGVVPAGSSYEEAESWARAEGFSDFWDACKWFTERYGAGWQTKTWGIIQFDKDWRG